MAIARVPKRRSGATWSKLASYAFENANGPMIVSDTEGRILEWNARFAALYGYSPEELSRLRVADLRSDATRAALVSDLEFATLTGEGEYQTEHRRKDGAVFPVEISLRRMDLDGISYWVGTLRNVSDTVARSNAELERLMQIAAHDLQEPIRSLVSYSQLLARRYGGRLDADADDYIGFLVSAAKRLGAMVRDLLSYSRLASIPTDRTGVDMREVVAVCREKLRFAIMEAGARIEVGPLPVVLGTEMHLAELIQNLLDNSLKFRRPDIPSEISVTARQGHAEWVFAVADNGIGVEAQYLGDVFEIFRRLHTLASYPGTGIGLAVCKLVVENHGGRIWMESVPGRGTTVSFTLPGEIPSVRTEAAT